MKLSDIATVDRLSRERRDLLSFTDALARPKEKHDDPRKRRRPGELFVRDVEDGRRVAIHPELVGMVNDAIVIRAIDEANRAAQRSLDAQLRKIDDQLKALGVDVER